MTYRNLYEINGQQFLGGVAVDRASLDRMAVPHGVRRIAVVRVHDVRPIQAEIVRI